MKHGFSLPLAGIVLLLGTGAAATASAFTGQQYAKEEAEAAGAENGAGASSTAHGTVPPTLQRIEGNAEDIIDFAAAGHWQRVSHAVASIDTSWKAYQGLPRSRGASGALLQSFASKLQALQQAAEAEKSDATMQAANDLSAVVAELYDLYNPVVPADVGRLDVVERQVVLDASAKDFTAAEEDLARAKALLERLEPSVQTHGGAALAKRFQRSLADQLDAARSGDGAALAQQARNALELVDGLEKLY